MPSMDRLSSYCTTIASDGNATRVTYHRTPIVTFDADSVTLRTGGWDTVTTRRKMNQAARQFRLGFSVYRDKGESYVALPSGRITPLAEIVTFSRDA